jgi:hypothetical protein
MPMFSQGGRVESKFVVVRYIGETYDTLSRLLPRNPTARAKVREWMAAAEGTLTIHGLAVSSLRCEIYTFVLLETGPAEDIPPSWMIRPVQRLVEILYARWRLPKPASEYLPEMEKGMAVNVQNHLNWLESEVAGRHYPRVQHRVHLGPEAGHRGQGLAQHQKVAARPTAARGVQARGP